MVGENLREFGLYYDDDDDVARYGKMRSTSLHFMTLIEAAAVAIEGQLRGKIDATE